MPLLGVKQLFNRHSVSVSGPKGSGKDMLFGNVIARRIKQKYYISNIDYKIRNKRFIRLDIKKLLCDNNYRNFIYDNVSQYIYPYKDGVDIYISDCGVYFPCQYNGQLNNEFKDFPTFMALSRQLGNCFIHTNCQQLTRVWDKIREQSDRFIVCQKCFVIGKIVLQNIRIYEREESAVKNIPPFRAPTVFGKDKQEAVLQEKLRYINTYGKIENRWLVYWNKTKYDTRYFRELLEKGGINEK